MTLWVSVFNCPGRLGVNGQGNFEMNAMGLSFLYALELGVLVVLLYGSFVSGCVKLCWIEVVGFRKCFSQVCWVVCYEIFGKKCISSGQVALKVRD